MVGESFSDSTDVNEADGTRSKSINAIAASVGIVSFDICPTSASSCLFSSSAVDDTIAILASVPKNPASPKVYSTPKFTTTIQSLHDFSHAPAPFEIASSSATTALPYFHNITSLVASKELINPGIAMPLSFVRRFHNEAELE
jgi:hypothetical protein